MEAIVTQYSPGDIVKWERTENRVAGSRGKTFCYSKHEVLSISITVEREIQRPKGYVMSLVKIVAHAFVSTLSRNPATRAQSKDIVASESAKWKATGKATHVIKYKLAGVDELLPESALELVKAKYKKS